MGLLAGGVTMLGTALAAAGGVTVTYRRGAASVELTAVRGRSEIQVSDELGPRVEHSDVDYLVAAADLVLGGVTVAPQRGDQIEDAGETYEVCPLGNAGPWRWSDSGRTRMRIHTKRVE